MTENSVKVLDFLKANYGKKFTKQEIAAALSISMPAVTGSIRGQVTKGLVNEEAVETTGENDKKLVTKYVTITDAGLDYDPEKAEAEAKAAKASKAKKAE